MFLALYPMPIAYRQGLVNYSAALALAAAEVSLKTQGLNAKAHRALARAIATEAKARPIRDAEFFWLGMVAAAHKSAAQNAR